MTIDWTRGIDLHSTDPFEIGRRDAVLDGNENAYWGSVGGMYSRPPVVLGYPTYVDPLDADDYLRGYCEIMGPLREGERMVMRDDERLDWPVGWIKYEEDELWHVHPDVDTTQYEMGVGRKVTLTEPAVCGAVGRVQVGVGLHSLERVEDEPKCETCLAMMEDLVYHALRILRVAGRTVGDGYSTSLTSPSEISPLATAYRTGERAVPSLDSIQAALDAVAHATAHQRPARYTGQDGTLTMTDANGAGIQVRLADWDITVKHDPDPRAFQTLAWKWGPPKP